MTSQPRFFDWLHERGPVSDKLAYRTYLAVEANLAREDQNINARTTWLLNSQGFLLAAYFLASSKNTVLPSHLDDLIGAFIASAGLAVCFRAARSIKAADEQIDEIKKVHHDIPSVDESGQRLWPHLRPYGSEKEHGDGRAFSRSLPRLVTSLWLVIGGFELAELLGFLPAAAPM